jgi:hypothetical protein
MTVQTIVDNGDVFPNRGAAQLIATISQNGTAKDVTGDTITATIRREESAFATVINAALEDHAVSLTTPLSGIVTLTLSSAEMAMLPVPEDPRKTYSFLVQFKDVTDNCYPQLFRFYAHGVLD